MSQRRTVLRWSPEGSQPLPADPRPLEERLDAAARDRVGAADEVVRDTARELGRWLTARDRAPEAAELRAALQAGLAAWARAQAWRGPCARFLLRVEEALAGRDCSAATLLARFEAEARAEAAPRRGLVPFALRSMERGERVLVRGASDTVAFVLEEAWRAGLEPEVLLGEGRPDLAGKRLARRLARRGLRVSVTYDAALPERVAGVDRVWLGTEALAAGAFAGRVGDKTLFGAAREQGVPVELLATQDKIHPAGRLKLPAWDAAEPWALWGDAPEGVLAEARFLERVELTHLDTWIHEQGRAAHPATDSRLLAR